MNGHVCRYCGHDSAWNLDRKQSADFPCGYPDKGVIPALRDAVDHKDIVRVLDPECGIGGVHKLAHGPTLFHPGLETVGNEIECCHVSRAQELYPDKETRVGDSCALGFSDDSFDAVVVSPVYQNRMSDWFVIGPDRKTKAGISYALNLGRPLDPRNSARHDLTVEGYWRHYAVAWTEAVRVLRPGGIFCLNAKDFYRGGVRQRIVDGHVAILTNLGLTTDTRYTVTRKGYGSAVGEHGNARVEGEEIVVLSAPLPVLEPVPA
jgi:SAM-dependent methyltransferase